MFLLSVSKNGKLYWKYFAKCDNLLKTTIILKLGNIIAMKVTLSLRNIEARNF